MSDDPATPDQDEVTSDLEAAKAAIEEATSDMTRVRQQSDEEPEAPAPVGPTAEEAQAAFEANPTIQVGGGPDSEVG
jgi:hypothetical protein